METTKPEQKMTLTGTYLRTLYQDPSTGWAIIELEPDDGGEIHACGPLTNQPIVGENLSLTGAWTRQRARGRVFSFTSYRAVAPRDAAYFKDYLSALCSISPNEAALIVDTFGADTLLVLSRSSERLDEIQGLKDSIKQKIRDKWRALRQHDHLADAMDKTGLNPEILEELAFRLPPDVDLSKAVSEDPWLIYLFTDATFPTVKRFVSSTGPIMVGHSIAAAIIAACRRGLNRGQDQISLTEGIKTIPQLLELKAPPEEQEISKAVEWLEAKGLIEQNGDVLVLSEVRSAQTAIAKRLRKLVQCPNEVTDQIAKSDFEQILKVKGALNPYFGIREALYEAITAKVSIIHAATPELQRVALDVILRTQEAHHFDIEVLTPRYCSDRKQKARNLSAAIGIKPFGPAERGRHAPLDAELIVVTDAHLLTMNHLRAVLDACDDESNLILIGSLYSESLYVPGHPLTNYAKEVTTVSLDHWYELPQKDAARRQIADLIKGEAPSLQCEPNFEHPLITLECSDEELPDLLISICAGDLTSELKLDSKNDVQVITIPPLTKLGAKFRTDAATALRHVSQRDDGTDSQEDFAIGRRVMLRAEVPSKHIPAYTVGTVTQNSPKSLTIKAMDKLSPSEFTLSDIEKVLASKVEFIPIGQAQFVRCPLIVLPVHSHDILTNADILAAMQCSTGWTVVVGSVGNVRLKDMRIK